MSLVHEHSAREALESLGLTVAATHLDAVAQRAAAEQWSYSHFAGVLLESEIMERRRRRASLNLQFANFPYLKRLGDFDYAAQPAIDRRLIEEVASGRYLAEARNIILLGPPGTGKTHIAISLGVLVAEAGSRVYFTTAMDLARKLIRAIDANRLHRELNALQQPKLLIIDEIGYLPFDAVQASLLFQVICRRYQKNQPLILTSNKAFGEWGHVFGDDPVMASAALDRLLHRSTIINIRGESYRLREKRQAGLAADLGKGGQSQMSAA
jgi:DNA replication protein DnaC